MVPAVTTAQIVTNLRITDLLADGHTLRVVGIGDVLPNGPKHTKAILKEAIYTPDMAFTLVSISWLDNAGSSVTFHKGMCTIKNPNG